MPENEVQIKITGDASQAKEAIDATKEQLDKASKSVEMLADLIGVKVPDALTKLIASSELAAPALEAIFPVVAGLAAIDVLHQLGEKLGALISDTFIFTDAQKEEDAALRASNKALYDATLRVKQYGRERQIAAETTETGKDKLRLQFNLEDIGGTSAALKAQIQSIDAQIADLQKKVSAGIDTSKIAKPQDDLRASITSTSRAIDEQRNVLSGYSDQIKKLQGDRDRLHIAFIQAEAIEKKSAQDISNDLALENAARLQKSIQTNIAKIEADKKTNDATIQQEKETIRELGAAHQISAEEELALNKTVLDQKFTQDETALNKKLTQLNRDRDHNAAQIITVQGEIKALNIQHYTDLEKLNADYYKQVDHNGQEAVNKAAAKMHALLQQVKEAQQIILESAKEHDQAMGQIADQRLNFELQVGKISQANYEKQLQWEMAETYFKQVSSSFNSALNGWLQGTETASQAFGKMFQDILAQLINFVELSAGQLCFLITDQQDNPISVSIGGGGQALKRGYCSPVTSGAVSPTFTVPNPANTLPSGIYYRITVKDSSTGQEVLRYTQVSFTGATFNFDNYAPVNLGTFAPLSGNSVSGNLAVSGNIAATGTVTGANIPSNILQQIFNSGVGLTQRTAFNCLAGVVCSDNLSAARTDVRLGSLTTVAFSATPTFDASTAASFKLTLTGNVTGSTLTNAVAGEPINFEICQDATGGRTFVPPTNVLNMGTIVSTANTCSTQEFWFDGTNAVSSGPMQSSGGSIIPGTLSVAGTSTLANVNLGAGNTLGVSMIKQVSPTTAFNISDNLGVSHFFISSSSPYTNTFVQGNGTGNVFFGAANKAFVADTTGAITTAGGIALQTTSQTLPASITNDTAGGILFTNNAGSSMQLGNGGTLFLNSAQGIRWTGATSGNTVVQAAAVAGAGILTLPATVTDTLVARTTTDTLTNKTLTSPVVNGGVSQGTGIKHQRFGASCTTGAAIGAACNSTYTWTSAFADSNYSVVCTGDNRAGTALGIPVVINTNSTGPSTFLLSIAAFSAAAAQFPAVDCIAFHD